MAELLELDVASPAAVFARQRAIETNLLTAAKEATRHFLALVTEQAARYPLHPPYVEQMWAHACHDIHAAVPEDVWRYVKTDYLNDEMPTEVYAVARAVLDSHGKRTASYGTIDRPLLETLSRALSTADFFPEQLTASISELEDFGVLESMGLTAAGYWDGLAEAGSVWIKRIRRRTRTSATGLMGSLTVSLLDLADFPYKRWVTRHDDRVRSSHRAVDGVTIPVRENFNVGGWPMRYPGDRDAEYGEVVSCRCVLTGVRDKDEPMKRRSR